MPTAGKKVLTRVMLLQSRLSIEYSKHNYWMEGILGALTSHSGIADEDL